MAAGVVLLIVIVVLVGLTGDHFIMFEHAYWTLFVRWLHIVTGIMWMGLLWYLNLVQTRTVPKIEPAEHCAATTKYIQPNVMFWFRYATLATVVFGLLLTLMNGYLLQALTFNGAPSPSDRLALIMAFNVWFIVWPNDKKALGIVEANAIEKAKAHRVARLAGRINTMLSIPMLYCMVAQKNLGGSASED